MGWVVLTGKVVLVFTELAFLGMPQSSNPMLDKGLVIHYPKYHSNHQAFLQPDQGAVYKVKPESAYYPFPE